MMVPSLMTDDASPFHPLVSDMDSSVSEFGHIHCCKWGYLSKKYNRMTNSVDPGKTSYLTGSALITEVSVLVCMNERV